MSGGGGQGALCQNKGSVTSGTNGDILDAISVSGGSLNDNAFGVMEGSVAVTDGALTNAGEIRGDITNTALAGVSNTGEIIGDVGFFGATYSIVNAGAIIGTISLDGTDSTGRVKVQGGTSADTIDGGGGNDTQLVVFGRPGAFGLRARSGHWVTRKLGVGAHSTILRPLFEAVTALRFCGADPKLGGAMRCAGCLGDCVCDFAKREGRLGLLALTHCATLCARGMVDGVQDLVTG